MCVDGRKARGPPIHPASQPVQLSPVQLRSLFPAGGSRRRSARVPQRPPPSHTIPR
ncbi:hypothetical protein BS50DRAFT_575233 [Corynespora cassiicola Philippines]|uniref:Uncharacterized protein n=1 Tax=Corynespora cassiicola Philippines TaxID=1448308 RepID=A0A2T2NI98_CORCC|nr:hypothetical protein BS50DRAFT_575233 [Corynespora cassiicola Philippines]